MTIFKLSKPLHEWRTLPRKPCGGSNGSEIILAPNVENWLTQRNITYDTWDEIEERPGPPGPPIISNASTHKVIVFYIDIPEPNAALLFKLTWM